MSLFQPNMLMSKEHFITMLLCALPVTCYFFAYLNEAREAHSMGGMTAYDRYHTLSNRLIFLSIPLIIVAAIILHQGVVYIWFFTR